MASNIVDPVRVEVSTEISIHEAITAVMMFAEKYPAERLTRHMAKQLRSAARMIDDTLSEYQVKKQQENNLHRSVINALGGEGMELSTF